MHHSEPRSHSLARQVEGHRSAAVQVKTQVGQCLVVSASQPRREMLARASLQAGWDTIVSADPQNALAAFRRTRFHLAMIDLDYYGRTPDGFRELCQTLAVAPDLLMLLCGQSADPQEEIWARQLGVWLYLPGVALEHNDDLATLCEQAQQIAGLAGAPT